MAEVEDTVRNSPISPCFTCKRRYREDVQTFENINAAASYLIFHAAEAAGDESGAPLLEPSPEVTGTVFGAYIKEDRVYFGAALLCGRTIGKGHCAEWRYDEEAHQVVSRSEPAVIAEE